MPVLLPSGLELILSGHHLFDHGGNCFACPDGHFWYWVAAPEMGSGPFDPNGEVMQIVVHSAVPKDREEAKRFVRVMERRADGQYGWRGEWLGRFPTFTKMDARDLAAWNEWLADPERQRFLDKIIDECARLAELSRHAQGYVTLRNQGEPDEQGWISADFVPAPLLPSDDDASDEVSEEFMDCWSAAGLHLQNQVQDASINWLKADPSPPFLEHLSFRLENQLFFIRIEDVEGRLAVPGSQQGLLSIANGCKGHACLMPMRCRDGIWAPEVDGWGLVDVRTGKSIDPFELASDERIEMTDWELHDYAVQVVKGHLERDGKELTAWQGNPAHDPSIWFDGDNGPEWVVVRAVRYPVLQADPPAHWPDIAERCAQLSKVGHFASVSVANADDAFDPSGDVPAEPLWRGDRYVTRFEGLVPAPMEPKGIFGGLKKKLAWRSRNS